MRRRSIALFLVCLAPWALACSRSDADAAPGGDGQGGRGGRQGGDFGGSSGVGDQQQAAVPVDVAPVTRRDIADNLETTGVLEAEQEVDIVARTAGPIVELAAEEGQFMKKGQLLARIDPRELQAQLAVTSVAIEEARANFERAKSSFEAQIVSREAFDQTRARYLSAEAQLQSLELQLSYTEIRAPFEGLIIERAIKFAEFVSNGTRLFRISDFDPLLCYVQIPEKDLGRLAIGQRAKLEVDAFPTRRFEARVLRINPVIDAATGTFKVTLSVGGESLLRPGMFASVFLETAVHEDALVIPKRALVLESIGDSVYVAAGDRAQRREVRIGYQEADDVEVLSGLAAGERVVVVGQDELSEGTPIQVLSGPATGAPGSEPTASASPPGDGRRRGQGGPGSSGGMPQIDWDDQAQVDRIKSMMRQRGLTDEQIEQRIERMKSGDFGPGRGGPPTGSRL
ncbi:MAG TPA: efflux RND transporter periplasmic adaptor subunit [Thermoanaerobaculia bacterium]|nr:efflux RND transporter periplasmic adaptor subunit [Thermoanaerobaculia bacterium]